VVVGGGRRVKKFIVCFEKVYLFIVSFIVAFGSGTMAIQKERKNYKLR
jgi:hypothetical protein